jgi:hypothetical protein
VGVDASSHTRLLGPPPHAIEHLLLEINGNHLAVIADHLRHCNRKQPHAAALGRPGCFTRDADGVPVVLWGAAV